MPDYATSKTCRLLVQVDFFTSSLQVWIVVVVVEPSECLMAKGSASLDTGDIYMPFDDWSAFYEYPNTQATLKHKYKHISYIVIGVHTYGQTEQNVKKRYAHQVA